MALKIVEDHRGEEFLNALDDNFLSCRSQRHSFPKLIPGKRLPKGVAARNQRDGSVQLVYVCPDCTTERRMTLMEGQILPEMGRHYNYKHPKGYLAPKGSQVNRRDAVVELFRRMESDIKTAAHNSAVMEQNDAEMTEYGRTLMGEK